MEPDKPEPVRTIKVRLTYSDGESEKQVIKEIALLPGETAFEAINRVTGVKTLPH